MSRGESFLQRWSRRKTERSQQIEGVSSTESQARDRKPESAPSVKDLPARAKEEQELPSIDSLGKDSDFTVFLREGVPEALKQQALRKLWASDPAFGAPDLLDIHAIDYSQLGRAQEVVQTAYQVGKRFIDQVDKAADALAGQDSRAAVDDKTSAQEPGRLDAAKAAAEKPSS
jgi:hypothetical protein